MKKWILLGAYSLLSMMFRTSCGGSHPNWTATDESSMTDCFTKVSNGDTITIPNVTIPITGVWTLNNNITIQAQNPCGTQNGQGVITGIGAGAGVAANSGCGAIIDQRIQGRAWLVNVQGGAGAVGDPTMTTRITGIKFTSSTIINDGGTYLMEVTGCNDKRRIRIDHNYFDLGPADAFAAIDTTFGPVDHNYFATQSTTGQVFVGFTKAHFYGSCGSNTWGDGSWADDDNFGTDKFTFYEDNIMDGCGFTNADVGNWRELTVMDGLSGQRSVIRHNDILCSSLESHGLEDTRDRSVRAVEIYNNYFGGDSHEMKQTPTYYRGGVGVVHDNTIVHFSSTANFGLLNNRSLQPNANPIGGDSGRNPWDVNNGGNPIVSGTVTCGGACTDLTLSDSMKSWTTDQYANYTIRKTSGVGINDGGCTRSGGTVTCNTVSAHGFVDHDAVSIIGGDDYVYQNNVFAPITVTSSTQFTFPDVNATMPTAHGSGLKAIRGMSFAYINSNTSTQLSYTSSLFSGFEAVFPGSLWHLTFSGSDTYEINLVTHAYDQVGRGAQSGVTTNLNGALIPTYPGSNDQVTSPWYEWNNTREAGANVDFSTGRGFGCGTATCLFATIVNGTHYKNDTVKPGYSTFTYPHPLVNAACVADHLTFTSQPSNAAVGASLGTVTVAVKDSGGNTCNTDTSTITIANKGGTCTGMTLGGSTSGANIFTTGTLTENATGACTLHATDGSLTAADSNAITISALPSKAGRFRVKHP